MDAYSVENEETVHLRKKKRGVWSFEYWNRAGGRVTGTSAAINRRSFPALVCLSDDEFSPPQPTGRTGKKSHVTCNHQSEGCNGEVTWRPVANGVHADQLITLPETWLKLQSHGVTWPSVHQWEAATDFRRNSSSHWISRTLQRCNAHHLSIAAS